MTLPLYNGYLTCSTAPEYGSLSPFWKSNM